MSSTEPTTDEILGHELPDSEVLNSDAVPVEVQGTVRAQLVGSQVGVARSITLTTTPETIVGTDPRRRRVVLIAAAAIRVGDYDDVQNDSGFVLAANVPLEMTHTDAVWARADTGTARLSILVEEWTG